MLYKPRDNKRTKRFSISLLLGLGSLLAQTLPALSLPPPEEIPEEILRTEIITEARSPLNNEPLTAAEYAELQAILEEGPEDFSRSLPQEVRDVVFLLRLRRAIRTFFPFLLQ